MHIYERCGIISTVYIEFTYSELSISVYGHVYLIG